MAIRAWAVSLGPENYNEVLRDLVSKHQGLALIAARLDQVWKYGSTQGRSRLVAAAGGYIRSREIIIRNLKNSRSNDDSVRVLQDSVLTFGMDI